MSIINAKKEHMADIFKTAALQAASPIVLALQECEDDLREEALALFEQLASGELSPDEEFSTATLLAEILFPNRDDNGFLGLDLEEAEAIAKQHFREPRPILNEMDQQEESFATKLKTLMSEKGVTQTDLANKLGIGQPAISMMLGRQCRPQKRTIVRLADALGVETSELWPGI